MLRGKSPNIIENSALVVGRFKNSNRGEPCNNRIGNIWCDHCKKLNHNKENCWRLHGKPNWSDNKGNRRDPQGFQTMTDTTMTSQRQGDNKAALTS